MDNRSVSIVMTYFDRKEQLMNTLKSFALLKYENFQVIIVDDSSIKEPLEISDLEIEGLDVVLIKIDQNSKWYTNSCIPFNKGFEVAEGDIIIIQNAECIHTTDILSHCRNNLTEQDYFAYGCFSISEHKFKELRTYDWDLSDLKKLITDDKSVSIDGENGWYNHSLFRPVSYHFTSAITKNKLRCINGFDVRYANGIGFDDNEILERIKRLGLSVSIIDDYPVIHQWHYSGIKRKDFAYRFMRNEYLFNHITKNEKGFNYSIYSLRYLLFNASWPLIYPVAKLGRKP